MVSAAGWTWRSLAWRTPCAPASRPGSRSSASRSGPTWTPTPRSAPPSTRPWLWTPGTLRWRTATTGRRCGTWPTSAAAPGRSAPRCCGATPHLRGTLADLPETAARARQYLAGLGLDDRCEVVGQSFFDPLPAGADAYLLSRIIHDWDDAAASAVLRRCAEAAGSTGRVLVIESQELPGLLRQGKVRFSTDLAYLPETLTKATIPQRADQAASRLRRGSAGGRPPAFDPAADKQRNAVERAFGQASPAPRRRRQVRQTQLRLARNRRRRLHQDLAPRYAHGGASRPPGCIERTGRSARRSLPGWSAGQRSGSP